PAGLLRAAGRVVLGIEVEDDRLAPERGEIDGLAFVRRELEIRGGLSLLDHGSILSVATLRAVRLFRDMNPTLRGFLIIAAVAAVIVVLQLQATLVAISALLQV